MIETERTVIRKVKESDLEKIVQILGNKEISQWLVSVPYPYSLEQAKVWYKKDKSVPYIGGIVELKATKQIIGRVSIYIKDMYNNNFGLYFDEDYQHQGYGYETSKATINEFFKQYPVRKINSGALIGNIISQKLHEKLGFKQLGIVDENHRITNKTLKIMKYELESNLAQLIKL